ncbi:hypothetical protein A6A04_18015 [Paramagnetospirillum marisnigri]|uniref:NHLP bacteriocin export ABC transporter permease/ATPase subunit n=1 Tax=Paramagnetospirillum marisnigri TaxID=1285242 RepID=A0A178MNW6_9PROT|nr:NHLP bacteriocin export ABC transporter permease/ATPase subunit [Paramagnetospirillum marisnigri]OAN50492.1 hypothetical protein A6A04_18015 [Paramagnetospirillum marisnigri]
MQSDSLAPELRQSLVDALTGLGHLVQVDGRWSRRLDHPDLVLLVLDGKIELLLVTERASDGTGIERRPLFAVAAGEAALAMPPGRDDQCDQVGTLMAVGVATGTRVLEISRDQLFALAEESSALRSAVAGILDAWLTALSGCTANRTCGRRSLTITDDSPITVEEPSSLASVRGVWWVTAEGDLPTPLTTATGLDVEPFTNLTIARTESLLPGLRSALDRHEAAEAIRLLAWGHECRLADRSRIDAQDRHERGVVERSFGNMLALYGIEIPPVAGPSSASRVTAACRLVAEAIGASVIEPDDLVGTSATRDILVAVIEASRLRSRLVTLDRQWWRHDNGPLVGFLMEGDAPVALLPCSGGGYRLVDPETGSRRRITAAIAQGLQGEAYTLYRPFPDQPLTAVDVLTFALRNTKREMATLLGISLAASVLALAVPVVTGLLFDSIVPLSARDQLFDVIFGLVAAAVGAGVFEIVRAFTLLRAETVMNGEVGAAVWDRLLKLPANFFRQFSTGELAQRANSIGQIRELLGGTTVVALLGGVGSLVNLILLFWYDARLATIAVGTVFVAMTVTLIANIRQGRIKRAMLGKRGRLSGLIIEIIRGIATIRVAGAEKRAFAAWASAFTEDVAHNKRWMRIKLGLDCFDAAYPIFGAMLLYMVMGYGGQPLGMGQFIAFSASFGQFLAATLCLSTVMQTALTVVPLYDLARPILHTVPESHGDKAEPGILHGNIEINNVSFRYGEDGPPVLREVSMRAGPGEFIAFVGPSGSGKSTVFRLLMGFETPDSGSIFYEGKDLAGLKPEAVRRQIGVVLQNGKLSSGSIFKNIVGSSRLTVDDAWEAAHAVGLADEIEAMPMGMHTVLIGGGTTLSGGQRQRLLIARALVHKPRIILFDEATSALDNRTQTIVSQSLQKLKATRVVIAHRLSTIQAADRIYVVVNGRVEEEGNFDVLMARNGVFAELARRQIS